MHLSRRSIVIVLFVAFSLTLLALFVLVDSSPTQDGRSTEQAEPADALSRVNPEEDYEILRQAGIPYENDRFAITYREQEGEPHGVVLIVIDKTGSTGVSAQIRSEALAYLQEYGITEDAVSIEYRSLGNVR